MSFNTWLKLKIKLSIIIVVFSHFISAQHDSLSIAASNKFIAFIDSVLTKEDPTSDYEINNFSTLNPIKEYPVEITSLAYPTLYNDRDEYYAAFLYREKFYSTQINYGLDHCVISTFDQLRLTITKGISKGKHSDKKEQKLINQLVNYLEKCPPPTIGYFQTASISFDFQDVKTNTDFQIVYDLNLEVQNFGRYVK
jgi:hypothetical protein